MNRFNAARICAIALALLTATSIGYAPLASASQTAAKAGRVTADRPNTILNGHGAPSTAIGIDGDFTSMLLRSISMDQSSITIGPYRFH